jgi:hypothetical protein
MYFNMYFVNFIIFGLAHCIIGVFWLIAPLNGFDSIPGMTSPDEPMGYLLGANLLWLGLLSVGVSLVSDRKTQRFILLLFLLGWFADVWVQYVNQCYVTIVILAPALFASLIALRQTRLPFKE